MTIKEKENSVFMNRLEEEGAIIQLRHIHGQRGGAIHVYPTYDKKLQRYLGFKKLSDRQKEDVPWFINSKSNMDFEDRMEVNLSDEQTLAHWRMAKFSPKIAFSEKEARESDSALFYIHSEREATKIALSKDMRSNRAKNLITEDKVTNLVTRARLLGFDMSSDDTEDVLLFLFKIAETNPEKIEGIYEDAQNNLRMLLAKGLAANIIREDNKFLMYGAFNVGNNEDTFVRLMSMSQSVDLLEQMRKDIEGDIGMPNKKTESINTKVTKPKVKAPKQIIEKPNIPEVKVDRVELPALPKAFNKMGKKDCLEFINKHTVKTIKPVSEYSFPELKKIITGVKM